jgi:serine/threonine-protein kinase ATR
MHAVGYLHLLIVWVVWLMQRAIANIEARLQGVVVGVGAAPSLPLSVEGQAHRLIAEAVSHTNLSQMYIWWMAWF